MRLRLAWGGDGLRRVPELRRGAGLVVRPEHVEAPGSGIHAGVPRFLTAAGLIGLMALGSIALWLLIPFGWIYLASQMVSSSQPTMGPYVMVIVGIPLSMVVVGKLLSRLNRVYGDVMGVSPEVRVRAPWHRSMRDGRDSGRRTTILDVVMVLSVGAALIIFGLWFFLFAGSSLPT
jgi:hypothetical protein